MTNDERQFLLTAAWMFMRHGQAARARAVCEAVVEENPRDGVASVALAALMLGAGEAPRAVEALRATDVPPELAHAAAFLEARALRMAGRDREAASRWSRYIESRKGAARRWTA
jgi:predicted Zn-dependent protease